MSERPAPVFLERRTYRRRRLMDAARLLPVVGLLLFLVPLLLAPDKTDTARTAGTSIYVFAVWFGLILCAFALSRSLSGGTDAAKDRDGAE